MTIEQCTMNISAKMFIVHCSIVTCHLGAVLPLHFCQGNFINPAFGDCEISVLHGHHVPNNTTAGWDQPGLELLGFGIEPDQRVRLHSRFAVPDDVVISGNAVRQRGRTAWGWPLFRSPWFRIET